MCDPAVRLPAFVVGLDLSQATASCCLYTSNKTLLLQPFAIPNTAAGFAQLHAKLTAQAPDPTTVLVGFEATGRCGDALYHFLQLHGYQVQVLHPAQTAQFARQRGLRAKTDRLDATTIARVLLSGEARAVYVPDAQIRAYCHLERLHTTLSTEAGRYKQEIRDLLTVVFPEYTQVFADPTGATALGLVQHYPPPAALLAAGVAAVTQTLRELAGRRYGGATAKRLLALAATTIAPPTGTAYTPPLQILCDQLQHTQANLAALEAAVTQLLVADEQARGLRRGPEFGWKTQAVLRAELGDVRRFQRSDQVVAYVGLDLVVRQSGQWRGHAKLSKRGSGRLRRSLYMAAVNCLRRRESACKNYYVALTARGLSGPKALMG